MNRASLVVT